MNQIAFSIYGKTTSEVRLVLVDLELEFGTLIRITYCGCPQKVWVSEGETHLDSCLTSGHVPRDIDEVVWVEREALGEDEPEELGGDPLLRLRRCVRLQRIPMDEMSKAKPSLEARLRPGLRGKLRLIFQGCNGVYWDSRSVIRRSINVFVQ